MAWVAVAIGGGTLASAYINSQAMNNAANTQADASRDASAAQLQMYNQQREDYTPWREAGMGALGGLQNEDFQKDFTMADYQQDPGYQFRLSEGQKAIERSAAARGGLNSGATMKALTRYGQDFASNEYQNAYNRFNADRDRRFNRLASIAGVGQTATGATAAAGQNYANNVSNNVMGAANTNAALQIGQANNMNNMIGNLGNAYMSYQMMNRLAPMK